MKKLFFVMLLFSFLTACSIFQGGHHGNTSSAAAFPKDTAKGSLPYVVSKNIGKTTITINYHAPAVRGRIIWGGLVPYDAVWVTGAHNATTFEINKNFEVGNQTIPAGKYALFTIPGKEEWTIILNKRWNQHLADDYSQAEDVARIKVKPQATEAVTERLKYVIDQTRTGTVNIIISWEKLQVPFELKLI